MPDGAEPVGRVLTCIAAQAGGGRWRRETNQQGTPVKADLAELRADIYRALWNQGGAIVAILGGSIAIAATLKLL